MLIEAGASEVSLLLSFNGIVYLRKLEGMLSDYPRNHVMPLSIGNLEEEFRIVTSTSSQKAILATFLDHGTYSDIKRSADIASALDRDEQWQRIRESG